MPLCNPLPLSVAGPSDWLLVNRIQQKSRDVTSWFRPQKDCDFCLACRHSPLSALALVEASCRVVSGSLERSLWQGTNVSDQQPRPAADLQPSENP